MKTLIIIPAFNEGQVIGDVISQVKQVVKSADIVVINDGSRDSTEKICRNQKITVISHAINRGLGGAIGTGLDYAKSKGYQAVVTFDADGQHDPLDIKRVLLPIKRSSVDVVIGSRTKQGFLQIPLDRRVLLTVSNFITLLMFGFVTSDSQSGFRAFSKKALSVIQLKTQAMEVSSEIFSQIRRHGLKYEEVPITVKYTSYSRKKGQTNTNAINVGIKLLLRLGR